MQIFRLKLERRINTTSNKLWIKELYFGQLYRKTVNCTLTKNKKAKAVSLSCATDGKLTWISLGHSISTVECKEGISMRWSPRAFMSLKTYDSMKQLFVSISQLKRMLHLPTHTCDMPPNWKKASSVPEGMSLKNTITKYGNIFLRKQDPSFLPYPPELLPSLLKLQACAFPHFLISETLLPVSESSFPSSFPAPG